MDRGTDLKPNERALLRRFLGTYLLSTFIMLTAIVWLLYSGKIQHLKENERLKMQEFSSRLAGALIDTAMMGRPLKLDEFSNYTYALYDKHKVLIMGKPIVASHWKSGFYILESRTLYMSRAAKGHMGVEYIVLEDRNFYAQKQRLLLESIFIYIVLLLGMFIVAWVLSKLFLYPIEYKVEMLNRFVKDSTHELNTPIASLLLTADSIEKDPQNRTALNRLRVLARNISNLYSDLAFAQLQNMKTMEQEEIDLCQACEEVLIYLEPLAKQKHISIKKYCHESIKWVMAQEAAKRMISNLLANAIKYTPKGGVITIVSQDNLFKISDTGIGIDKKHFEEIFTRYQRIDRVQGGFGIGLDIVMRVCKEYGITLKLESEKEKGSTFILHFSS